MCDIVEICTIIDIELNVLTAEIKWVMMLRVYLMHTYCQQ